MKDFFIEPDNFQPELLLEAKEIAKKLADNGDPTSDEYGILLARLEKVESIMSAETKRLEPYVTNAFNKQRDKERAKQDRWDCAWDIMKTVLGGVVAVGGNAAIVYLMLRGNNSGETLANWEQKFISPVRLR